MPKQPKIDEDYPGQQREIEIGDAVRKAIMAADHIILEASDGSVEETDYLTMKVAEAFFNKVACAVNREYSKKQFSERVLGQPKFRTRR